ncbi:MAG: RNA-directed DNA polymerase [Chloroflexi bacterium]|nr:RNA-directed DNA polymerase [Chloroflexota bacterium]
MSRLAALKASTSLSDLARLLDFKPQALAYILYKQPEAKKYTTFQIPKRNGGQRTIKAPVDALKLAQRRLSHLLQDCLEEINTNQNRKDRTAHGFKRKRSIITNARQHRHRRYVFNLDLEDFFPSINFGRVRGFLIKNRDFALHEHVATVIAQIACHENSLPQGSPCSPVISNLVAHLLDMRLVSLASAAGCTYSRYADDLTFSTNKKEFPTEIAVPLGTEGGESHLWGPGDELQKVIERMGFRISAAKTHLMYRTSRQDVTGLVVNEKINVRWEYRHNVRAMVHRLITTGAFEIYGVTQRDGKAALEKRQGPLNELHGMLGFIDSIENYNKKNTHDSPSDRPSSMELVYRQFLIYRNFYAAESPVVICEGDTDNIYLTHAIRNLAAEFLDLAEVKEGKIRLKVRLFKYPHSSTARILDLGDGGSGVLSDFIGTYKREIGHFTAPSSQSPVVIIYDNDSGARGIRSAIRSVSKVQPTGTEPYVHVVKNLYALATPLVGTTTESKIEDFFDDAIKATVIDGKTFNDKNKIDAAKHYSKTVFAHRVVRPNADTINFSGFRPLLTNLVAVINAHKASIAV